MAINIPCIVYWDPTAYGIDDFAVPYFKSLKDAGIIFRDSISAADKLNDIFPNITNWWQQPSIQKARKKWANQFARTNKNWQLDWASYILNMK